MKIKYIFANGETSTVEVDESIGTVVLDSRRKEENLSRKERYHCFSLDGAAYDGNAFSVSLDFDAPFTREETQKEIEYALTFLTDTQRRRLLLYIQGLSIREIARREGVSYISVRDSIEQARKKIKKFL